MIASAVGASATRPPGADRRRPVDDPGIEHAAAEAADAAIAARQSCSWEKRPKARAAGSTTMPSGPSHSVGRRAIPVERVGEIVAGADSGGGGDLADRAVDDEHLRPVGRERAGEMHGDRRRVLPADGDDRRRPGWAAAAARWPGRHA